jgi:hypothetical protein
MSKFNAKSLNAKYDSYFDKWTSKSYSSGYKSNHKTYGNSSFWMDEDFLSKGELGSKTDHVKLAGYKRAISNFVRIVTGKDNIKVQYSSGNSSYTDGKEVVISSKLDEKEFDSTVGLALHEGSHIALTNFNVLTHNLYSNSAYMQLVYNWLTINNIPYDVYDVCEYIKNLLNVIEDRRIDRFVYNSAPGYQGYYKSMYEKYFNAKEIDKALLSKVKNQRTYDDYLFHIVNFANPNRQLGTLPELRTIWNTIDIANISRLKSTGEALDLAVEVFKIIAKDVNQQLAQGQKQVSQSQQGKPDNPNDDSGSDSQDVDSDSQEDDSMGSGEGDPNLDIQGSPSSSSSNSTPKDAKQAAKEAKEAEALEKAIQKQKDFLKGNIKKSKLSKQDAEKINAAAEANMNYETVGGGVIDETGRQLGTKTTQCMVVKGMNKAMLDAGLLGGHWESPENRIKRIRKFGYEDYITAGITLGTMLGKKLKTRDEDREIKTTRMETGKMDRRLLNELGFGNERVFSQVVHKTVTPSVIHISLDASGSMSGGLWSSAMKTAVAIAKAASMVQSMQCIISIRGNYYSERAQYPLMWIIYDSSKDKFNAVKDMFYGVQALGSTPEGLCYEAVMKDMIKTANGKDMYFVNICDGEPGYSDASMYYTGEYAINHTKNQIHKMRQAGIKPLAYFVADCDPQYATRSKIQFDRMYGKDSRLIDVNNLAQLSKSLNERFVRPV